MTLFLETLSNNILFEKGWRITLGAPLKPVRHGTGSEWGAGWVLPRSSSKRGIHRDGRPWWEAVTGATWESDAAGPDGIYSRAHLFRSTNIWNSRDSDKDTQYLISLKIKKLKTYYLSQRDWGRQGEAQRWPGHEQSPSSGLTETEKSLSLDTGGIVSPAESKGYAAVVSPSTSEGDLMWKQGHCKCNLPTWGEAIPERTGP